MNFIDPGSEALVRCFLKRAGATTGRSVSTRSDPSFRRTGDSFDLKSIRAYYPGDDPRHIDWRLFGRTGRHFIKEFFDDTGEGLCILVDISASVRVVDSGIDEDCSLRAAASMAWIVASLGVPVDLMAFSERLRDVMPHSHGSPSGARISGFLAGLERGGRTDIGKSLREAKSRSPHRRVLVISDFLDESFSPARCPFSRFFAIRLHRELAELAVGMREALIQDPESGNRMRIGVDDAMWRRYRNRETELARSLGYAWSRSLEPGAPRVPLYRELVEAILA